MCEGEASKTDRFETFSLFLSAQFLAVKVSGSEASLVD